jgi:hypothetical protein
MKSLFTIALLTAGLQALHLNTDNNINAVAYSTLTEETKVEPVASKEEILDIS